MCFGKASWLFPICCCQATLSQPLLELLWFSWFSQLMTFVASDIHKTGLQIKNGNFPSQAHFSDPSGKGEVRTSTNSPRFCMSTQTCALQHLCSEFSHICTSDDLPQEKLDAAEFLEYFPTQSMAPQCWTRFHTSACGRWSSGMASWSCNCSSTHLFI